MERVVQKKIRKSKADVQSQAGIRGRTFAIVDVETSGTSAVFNRVIEIGILRIEDGVCVETYRTCVDPGHTISPWITTLTGITQEEVQSAPLFEDIIDTVERLLTDAIFVAHNARFDYAFIKNEFKRAGRSFSAKCLCTVRLSRALYPRSKHHDLSTLIEQHGFSCESRHRALDDAKVLWDFLQLCEREHTKKLAPAIDAIVQKSSLPQLLDARTVKNLPEAPGVYIFYGEADEPLYIGKSRNLRYRVLSHFSGDHAATKELVIASQVRRVETRETAGELSALLLESSLIKSMHPVYNRMLRKRRELVIARRSETSGYASLTLERVEGIAAHEYTQILGVFKNIAQAKQFISDAAKEHSLCKRILGLESARGGSQPKADGPRAQALRKNSTRPCFGYQLDACFGACIGKEEAEAYNERLLLAFKTRRLRAWPYTSAIIVEERKDDLEKHSFILDNWCLVGDVRTGEDGFEFRARVAEFDYDSYKIFARYVRDPLNQKNIKLLPQREFEKFLSVEEGEEAVIS